MSGTPYARRVWQLLETLHAVTYFADECRTANREVGLRGFWMGYFAARSAPLGAVDPAVVTATFANFSPDMVARSLPDAWTHATPAAVLEARASSAAAALRRAAPGIDAVADRALPLLGKVAEAAAPAGRPLFAANRAVSTSEDPVAALWQSATTLREHRGDGHVACLVTAALDGCGIHVLFAASTGTPPALLRDNRGWTHEDWAAATARLEQQGLVAGGTTTPAGDAVRAGIEARTDELAGAPYAALTEPERKELLGLLRPAAAAVVAADVIPFPNPMGLPRPGA
ncbi:MAG: hypothetical protein KY457_09095 [Actinobacteria bacterium]|nr:hypothetical protein [Actinomycetota bacterium]